MIERYLRSIGEIRDSIPPGLIVREVADVDP
jgi:hypothetical protein